MPIRINGKYLRNQPEQISKNMMDIAALKKELKDKEYTIEDMKIENGHLIIYTYGGETIDAGELFNGDVAITGDLSATGDCSIGGELTANLILENMSGYSFTFENLHADITLEYAGIVKTGNKLTIAVAGHITPSANIAADSPIDTGTIHIPADIGAKLYPGLDSNRIIGNSCPLIVSSYDSSTIVEAHSYLTKWTNQELSLTFYNSDVLHAGDTYYYRQEITLLLSENLAQ